MLLTADLLGNTITSYLLIVIFMCKPVNWVASPTIGVITIDCVVRAVEVEFDLLPAETLVSHKM